MVPRWRFFGDFWVLHFQRAACSTFQTYILNFALGPPHVSNIHSATAEIRRGEKIERRKKPMHQTWNDLRKNFPWMSMDSQGNKRRGKIAENFNRLSRLHERYRRTTDRQTTDGRATAYSERERKFTFAKNNAKAVQL